MHELLVSVDQGSFIKPKRITLGEWLGDGLNGYVKTNCSSRTLDGYHTIMRCHLVPNLGMIPLSQLHPQHIQQYYAHAVSEPRADGEVLSARTVLHIHRVLFQALNYAVRQGLIIRNPAQLVDPPRAKKPEMRTLTPEEVSRLFGVAEDTPYYPIIYTAVKTGLRQAELLGLQWRDLDLDLDLASLSVTQVLYKRKGVCQVKEPKSEHSRRRLDLSPSLALFLWEYRTERQVELLLLEKPLSEDDLVFGNISVIPMDPGTLTHNFTRIARGAFLVPMLCSATIVVPAPGLMVVFTLGEVLNPLFVGLVSGVGGTIGEMTGYLLGYSGRAAIENVSLYQRMEYSMKRWGAVTLFVLALIPNPLFDVAGAIAGALRFPLWKFLLYSGAGRIIKHTFFAFAGAWGMEFILHFLD